MAGRGELGGQAAGRPPRRGHRVDRLASGRTTRGRRGRSGAGTAGSCRRPRSAWPAAPCPAAAARTPALSARLDAHGAAPLGRPVAVDLADDAASPRPGRAGSSCAGASGAAGRTAARTPVAGDLDRPVVERGQAVRHLDRGVVAVQHLEAQVGRGPAAAGDDVLGVVAQVGVEVQGVRVVQAQLGVRAGGLRRSTGSRAGRPRRAAATPGCCRPGSRTPRPGPARSGRAARRR